MYKNKEAVNRYMDMVVVELIDNHNMSASAALRTVKRSKLKKLFRKYPEEQFHQPVSAAANEILGKC